MMWAKLPFLLHTLALFINRPQSMNIPTSLKNKLLPQKHILIFAIINVKIIIMSIYKIVKGNSFKLHIEMQKAYISQNKQMLEDLDMTQVSNLRIELTDMFGDNIPLFVKPGQSPYIFCKQDGSKVVLSSKEVALTFPSTLDEGTYGIRITGKYNGNDFCSIERNLIAIVSHNSKTHIPLGIVEGEQGGLYNAKYWMELNTREEVIKSYYGALATQDANSVNLEYLQSFSGALSGQTINVTTTDTEDIIWIVSSTPLSFMQGGLPLDMHLTKLDELYYYSSDELIPGESVIAIV